MIQVASAKKPISPWPAAVLLAAALLGGALGGCVERIYNPAPRVIHGARITSPTRWKISGTLGDLPNAIDGNVHTAAVSAANASGAQITLDLGKMCLFNMVVVDHGDQQAGCCHRTSVYTSVDGANFRPAGSAPGVRRVTTVLLMTPTHARYVRVQVDEPGDQPWSVAELYLR